MKNALLVAVLLVLTFPLVAKADGMVVAPPDYYMYESSQRAVIMYDQSSQTETLVVSVRYTGDAEKFAWIIPVPNKPEVTKGSDELFTSLATLTNSSYYQPLSDRAGLAEPMTSGQEVEVVSVQNLDYFEVTTLTSTDSQALSQWLNEHGYAYPTDSDYILNSYITNQWYFVAVRFDLTSVSQAKITQLSNGHVTPLKLKFQTKNPVYPLRISSITKAPTTRIFSGAESGTSAIIEKEAIYPYRPSQVDIELYVLTDHKQSLPGFSATYGNWIGKKKIVGWAVDDQGDALLQPTANKYFLTKLTKSLSYSAMTDDLFPRRAENDQRVNASGGLGPTMTAVGYFLLALSLYSVMVFAVGLFSPFGVAFVVAVLIQFRCRSRAWQRVAWVIQSISVAVYAVAGLLITFAGLSGGSDFFDLPSEIISGSSRTVSGLAGLEALWLCSLILPIIGLLAGMIVVMIVQARRVKTKPVTPGPSNVRSAP